MADNSKIEWTESTWNPVTGCTKISDGCLNCYAFSLAKRLRVMNNIRYKNGFEVTLHNDLLELPLKWNKPKLIFVNSMSDLFHEEVPFEFIQAIFETMKKAYWHTFQILTKRSSRLLELSNHLPWPPNVWQGVTVESGKYVHRIDDLRQIPSSNLFISFEPLIGEVTNLNLKRIKWVIVGGESGPRSRPINKDWVIALRDRCIKENVPFFFKQWGGFNKKKAGRLLEGELWDEYPVFSKEFITTK